MLKYFFAAFLLLLPFSLFAEEIQWRQASEVVADINCDGDDDKAVLGYINSNVVVKVELSVNSYESSLRFGTGNSYSQDALCGKEIQLRGVQSNQEGFIEMFGELPDGYKSGKGCFELVLEDGECDSIHLFWNHNENALDWWRL